ncbi:MAG TPA: hypothetical protein VN822_11165 [Candidatus Acidoferrales bacterium]|nr:hypothetical protein [Candidatus Acidoferrales bacterium]
MILGMTPYTLFHVALSLIGIFSGFVVLLGLLAAKRLDGWTALFLITTVATSVTGFFFPFHGVTPGIVVGIISLVMLAIAIVARYALHLAGPWRWIWVVTAMMAQYLNVFVLVVQLYQKVPALKALDPTQSGPPFKATQGIVLVLFVILIAAAVIKFRPGAPRAA